MLLSCPGCYDIQCLKLYHINEERKVWQDICNSVAQLHCLFIATAHTFSPQNRLIFQEKQRATKTLWCECWTIYGCRQVGAGHWESLPNVSQRKVCQRPRPNYVEQPILSMWAFMLIERGSVKVSHPWMEL